MQKRCLSHFLPEDALSLFSWISYYLLIYFGSEVNKWILMYVEFKGLCDLNDLIIMADYDDLLWCILLYMMFKQTYRHCLNRQHCYSYIPSLQLLLECKLEFLICEHSGWMVIQCNRAIKEAIFQQFPIVRDLSRPIELYINQCLGWRAQFSSAHCSTGRAESKFIQCQSLSTFLV